MKIMYKFIIYDIFLIIIGFILKFDFSVMFGIASFFHDLFFYFIDRRYYEGY